MKRKTIESAANPIEITVPFTPPSVNHYVKHTRYGCHYVSAEAKAFKDAVCLFSKGKQVRGREYAIEVYVMLGAKQKGDIDNFAKVILDGLVQAEVIDSDAKVTLLSVHKCRDIARPRTEITVWERIFRHV